MLPRPKIASRRKSPRSCCYGGAAALMVYPVASRHDCPLQTMVTTAELVPKRTDGAKCNRGPGRGSRRCARAGRRWLP